MLWLLLTLSASVLYLTSAAWSLVHALTRFKALGLASRKALARNLAAPTTNNLNNGIPAQTQVLQETKSGNTLSHVPGVLQHDPSQVLNAQWSYFHPDAQNNRALTDGIAVVGKRWEYDPFGNVRTQGAAASDFQYAGEQKDAETGLINLRARYYDPALGRFVSRDPLSGRLGFPQTYNRYAYALNNPLRLR
jgi:RHS repeat-associated protein